MAAAAKIVIEGWRETGDTQALGDLLWDHTTLNRIEGRWVAEQLARGKGPFVAHLRTSEIEWFLDRAFEYGAKSVKLLARAVNE